MRSPTILVAALALLSACATSPVSVKTDESAPGSVRFTIRNRSERDIQRIRFELIFRSAEGATVRTDTTGYTLTLDHAE